MLYFTNTYYAIYYYDILHLGSLYTEKFNIELRSYVKYKAHL